MGWDNFGDKGSGSHGRWIHLKLVYTRDGRRDYKLGRSTGYVLGLLATFFLWELCISQSRSKLILKMNPYDIMF